VEGSIVNEQDGKVTVRDEASSSSRSRGKRADAPQQSDVPLQSLPKVLHPLSARCFMPLRASTPSGDGVMANGVLCISLLRHSCGQARIQVALHASGGHSGTPECGQIRTVQSHHGMQPGHCVRLSWGDAGPLVHACILGLNRLCGG
jgi:hypothetical protein